MKDCLLSCIYKSKKIFIIYREIALKDAAITIFNNLLSSKSNVYSVDFKIIVYNLLLV